jgi:hypothetical protein
MKFVTAALAATAVLAVAGSASAVTNLVQNGDFSENSTGASSDGGQVDYDLNSHGACTSASNCVTVTGWTVPTGGYTFLWRPGTAETPGANGSDGNVKLWQPTTGYDGEWLIGQDSDFQVEPIQQTITGLTVGDRYTLDFEWGGAQQTVQTGKSNDQFEVTLSKTGTAGTCSTGTFATTRCTPVVNVAGKGFSGWQAESMTFVATSRTEILSFLAKGTIAGEPSFALLDDVSMDQSGTPEPATWALMFLGVAGVGAGLRRRRRTLAA